MQDITTHLSFGKDKYTIINKLVDKIPQETRDKFEVTYEAWQKFCHQPKIMLSSISYVRAQGEAFEQLVQQGKTNPNEVMPLLVEKLMHEDQFMAHVIFEAITGVRNRNFAASQSIAFDLANNWLDEHEQLANSNIDNNFDIANLGLDSTNTNSDEL